MSIYAPRGEIKRLIEDLQASSQHAEQFKHLTPAKEDNEKLRLLRKRCQPECQAQEVAGEWNLCIEEMDIRPRSCSYKGKVAATSSMGRKDVLD